MNPCIVYLFTHPSHSKWYDLMDYSVTDLMQHNKVIQKVRLFHNTSIISCNMNLLSRSFDKVCTICLVTWCHLNVLNWDWCEPFVFRNIWKGQDTDNASCCSFFPPPSITPSNTQTGLSGCPRFQNTTWYIHPPISTFKAFIYD